LKNLPANFDGFSNIESYEGSAAKQTAYLAKITKEFLKNMKGEFRASLDAQWTDTKKWMYKILKRANVNIKGLQDMDSRIGSWNDAFDADGNLNKNSEYYKAMKNGEIEEMQKHFDEMLEKSSELKKAAAEAAAKEGKMSAEEKWKMIKSMIKVLVGCGAIGFAVWFAIQLAHDNTGCFSYVGSLGANRMACSDTMATTSSGDWLPNNCNCGGDFKPDMVSNEEIKSQSDGDGPPAKCALGGDQALAVGGSYATCTTSIATPKSVLYAYKEMSALDALAHLPSWISDWAGAALPGPSNLKSILMMVLYVGLGIIGVIILLMIIRFSWNYFKTHKDIGKAKGSGKKGSGKKGSGVRTRSRR
jgi:hypothetical protein